MPTISLIRLRYNTPLQKSVMRRKVLQGLANNICQMFVGYKLYHDMENVLMPLSQGKTVTLEIDILTGQCLANGVLLDTLTIPAEMRSWFAARLRQYHIPPSAITTAQLNVEYKASRRITKVGRSPMSLREHIGAIFGRQYRWDYWDVDDEFFCRSLIRTSDHEYFSINGKRGNKPSLPAT